jgi:hypothetical protein
MSGISIEFERLKSSESRLEASLTNRWQRYRYTLGTLWNVIGDQLPVISILVTFIFHTKVFGHNLNASTAFVALTV